MRRVLFLLVGALALGCASKDDPAPEPVAVPHTLDSHWVVTPHRISAWEISFTPAGARTGTLWAENDGGPFGAIDTPVVVYDLDYWKSPLLEARSANVQVVLTPGSEVDGVPFSGVATASVNAAGIAESDVLAAYIRGWRVDTDLYETPPAFETDIPYDPADGFTSQGFGIELGAPTRVDDRIEVSVRARNSLGDADRGDMNEAVPLATTWVSIDLVVIVCREACAFDSGTVEYFLSTADDGIDTQHPHADEADQQLTITSTPVSSTARALFGLTAFDIWVNQDDHKDPACVVVQDPENFEGDPISGPSRYMTSLSARIHDMQHDAAAGTGDVKVDLHYSNRSDYKEIGNLCVGTRGSVGMLQFDDADAIHVDVDPVTLEFEAGEAVSTTVSW